MKGKFEHRDHGTQGEHHVKMEAEIEVMLLQANRDKERNTKYCQQNSRN